MRVEDRLARASNWSPWKARMVFVLEDLELWDIVEARKRPAVEVDRVPSLRPHHREERASTTVGRRET
jgi:hypothetical protein